MKQRSLNIIFIVLLLISSALSGYTISHGYYIESAISAILMIISFYFIDENKELKNEK